MKLHVVGGFLGSGKTTAIIQAAKSLVEQGQRVGIITNDQGRYLVDTAFVRLSSIPAVEVSGGCFCCNYDDLDAQLAHLIAEARPDVIFAESVGSCADILTTVVRPLLAVDRDGARPASFSVFADARLLRRRLLGQEMPFSEDVVYVFDKQIEEAELLVINKADLLTGDTLKDTCVLMSQQLPEKEILTQSALTQVGVQPWLERIQAASITLPQTPLAIDYQRYGDGEARLAWLDAEIQLAFSPGDGRQVLTQLFSRFLAELNSRAVGIGHLKFLIKEQFAEPPSGAKISFVALEEPGWEVRFPEISGDSVLLLVNARVEMPADALRGLLHAVLMDSGLTYIVRGEDAFHPAQPNPVHRIS